MAKPIPKVITSGCNLLPTNDHGANGTGIDNVQGYRVQGHADLQKMTEPYSAGTAAFNRHGKRKWLARPGAPDYRLITSTKRGVALSSIRRLLKSNRLRSASCEGTTFCSARNMISVRPGDLRSHSCSISLTT